MIKTLDRENAEAYQAIRLAALLEFPEAFGSSWQEERDRSLADVVTRIEPRPDQVTLGAFDDDTLLGIMTLIRSTRIKTRHRASIAGMYVLPQSRGRSRGRRLLERGLEIAREWGVIDVSLGVTVGNDAARGLYAGMGFTTYGIDPRYINVDGRFFDVELMVLRV